MARNIFLRGARLIDGLNKPCNDMVIVITDDRISRVVPAARAPTPRKKDTVFDLGGKSVMPGMGQASGRSAALTV